MTILNSFDAFRDLDVSGERLRYASLPALAAGGYPEVARLPFSLKILLENLLRNEDGTHVTKTDIEVLATWNPSRRVEKEIAFTPARVLLQDFTGVPAVVDLAAMRDATARLGGDPNRVNPIQPMELVIDHSVQVDHFGTADAFPLNADLEYARNKERYRFLRWGQNAFSNFRVVPPETGIVHQVNLEFLARVVFRAEIDGVAWAYPDTVVGTDSHTTMVNGLGVVGWGVGGIEAEAPAGTTATDVVLTVTEALRKKGVVGKFVEFFGPGLASLTLADRATLSNMCPEYGATIAVFPIDAMTTDYLRLTGRDAKSVALVEAYARAQGFFVEGTVPEAAYDDVIELDLATVVPSLAGPKRPQDRVSLSAAKSKFAEVLPQLLAERKKPAAAEGAGGVAVASEMAIDHGAVVVAAITSCTNTSNPSVLIAAGLVAKKAVERGLMRKPWVKTSLAPGSKVVTDYLAKAGLTKYLDALGFNLVGYGCTTCIGNSGPLIDEVTAQVEERGLIVASVLSGNRNFEGRVQPLARASYLASPPLVVAYALAGTMTLDLTTEPLGRDKSGAPVYLKDIWPTEREIQQTMGTAIKAEMFREVYSKVFEGDSRWQKIVPPAGARFAWDASSTYIQNPPYFDGLTPEPPAPQTIAGARVLAVLGDSITTDHISPAGNIKADSPAGKYLQSKDVQPKDFNQYGARRGNHEVMMRGTFANIRLKNEMVPGVEGGITTYLPGGEVMPIFDAAMKYKAAGVPLVILAGKEYGSGSSRDWAAKGAALLGVKLVIAESFERIHRNNLVNMGVLALQFKAGQNAAALGLSGQETFEIVSVATDALKPRGDITVKATLPDRSVKEFTATVRIDTPEELVAFRHGGILQYMVRQMLKK
ncbi:MAG: aconitate hydratase AcnA [Acidobacteria bacterium]|nr:aconitate hydratase AcnA [Acidobacteriota bacterium]